MLSDLRKHARELLEKGDVKVVIGYGEGSGGSARAVFIRTPDDTESLILDDRCNQNLTVYLHKPEVRALGKPAVIARTPGLRTINQLMAENQIREGDIVVLGVTDEGTIVNFPDIKSVGHHISKIHMELTPENRERLDKISKMSREERWDFWVKELSACVKCYACRAACPLCYCEQCTVDCNKPQWISVPSHQLGNMEWHIMRAMHLAGRCVDCGDCYRACPLGIPLNLLTQKLHQDITEAFIISGVEEEKPAYPLGTFRPDDKEDFIR